MTDNEQRDKHLLLIKLEARGFSPFHIRWLQKYKTAEGLRHLLEIDKAYEKVNQI